MSRELDPRQQERFLDGEVHAFIAALDKRLASKTINSILAQNGEPELDKG